MTSHPFLRRATALGLSWVVTMNTILWAAPPSPPPPSTGSTQTMVPYVPLATSLEILQNALMEAWLASIESDGTTVEEGVPSEPFLPEPKSTSLTAAESSPPSSPETTALPEAIAAGAASGVEIPVFGPKKYVRTKGEKDIYTDTVRVPAWVKSPYQLEVLNGERDGSNRVSSAWIEINGVEVVGPDDFNQNVPALELTVTLTSVTSLEVTLASKPGSYLTINLYGQSADSTSPQVIWQEPVPGSAVNDETPRLLVKYQDIVGSGEPAASGVETSTLRVFLDDIDRTSLFTKREGEASANLPPNLALHEGTHRLRATIQDRAGNTGKGSSDFLVDLTSPLIEVMEPSGGSYLATRTPTIRIHYQDNYGLDLATLVIHINGEDRTSLFNVGPNDATAILNDRSALPNGPNQVVAKIRDGGGSESTATVSFHVDTVPPVLAIQSPHNGSRLGSRDVEVIVTYTDDQGLHLPSFEASMDDQSIHMDVGAGSARATLGPLEDGQHQFDVRIADLAGNSATAMSRFHVDTAIPQISIARPQAGSIWATAEPDVEITYSDNQGVDTSTLSVLVNQIDRTALFNVGADRATATLSGSASLPEGETTIEARIEDLVGNEAVTSATFSVDTLAPTGSVDEPPTLTNQTTPTVSVSFSDSGVGVNPDRVQIFVDGRDRTELFVKDSYGATGTLDSPLTDGAHDIRLVIEDRAGNRAEITHTFTVDTMAPEGAFVEPANDTFINDPTPTVRLSYEDGIGSGVDVDSLQVFFKRGDEPEIDITSSFQLGPLEGSGEITEPLSDGTHRLRALLSDRAGNATEVLSSFALDTVSPTYRIEMPAAGGVVSSLTPFFDIRYEDDHAGVDLSRFGFGIDGINLTARLTIGDAQATGSLAAEDALSEGEHQVEVTVIDRAGNLAAPLPHLFVVDTMAPTTSIETPPDGSLLASSPAQIHIVYSDGTGTGVDPASVRIEVDGVDRSAEFTRTATDAEASLTLPDGGHTLFIEVLDFAANSASATSSFLIDTQPPILSISSPPDSSYHGQSPVEIAGSVQDVDRETTLRCGSEAESVDATLTEVSTSPLGIVEWSYACSVPLVEGRNAVRVTASDRSGHDATVERSLILDTTPPDVTIVEPTDGAYTSGESVDVRGGVVDQSPVTVRVEGPETVHAEVSGSAFHATVGLGGAVDGDEIPLRAVAEDAAGNTGEDTVTVRVDGTSPIVEITSPREGEYIRSPVNVSGTVSDTSPVSLVNVNGSAVTMSGATFATQLTASDGPLSIEATAYDAAGNIGTDSVRVNVDSTPPVIFITSPVEGFVTNQSTILLAGTVTDASPVTLTLNGIPVDLPGISFSLEVPLPVEGSNTFFLVATDAAGNSADFELHVIRDTTPPELIVSTPAPDALVGDLPAVVQGFVSDRTETVVTVDGQPASLVQDAWTVSIAALPEGSHTFDVVATDAAGNRSQVMRHVVVDLAPPEVTITSPLTGSLTRAERIDVSGTVVDGTPVTVSVNGLPATVTGTGPFNFTAMGVLLADGDNVLRAVATDSAGRSGEAAVIVTQDAIPPVIDLVAPEVVSRIRGGTAVAGVTDNVAVAEVTLSIEGFTTTTFDRPPYEIEITVPDEVSAGDTLVITATASDTAGNVTTLRRDVRVIADGAIVGQVLSDADSLTLAEATVRTEDKEDLTDERGRYSLPTGEAEVVLVIEKEGMTSVERPVSVESGVGTVPVDARLTPLAKAQMVGIDGGALEADLPASEGKVTVVVPAGAVIGPTAFHLTPLSAQGLPGLLPLGWSPFAAFDLRTGTPVVLNDVLSASWSGLPSEELHLVLYRPAAHAWILVEPYLIPVDGSLTVSIQEIGSYSLVVPDAGNADVVVPDVGQPLSGVDMEILPASVTSTGTVVPPVLPPTGGVAWGTLSLFSPVPLPSGTVIQAEVTETFTLTSGAIASEEVRLEDIVLFQNPVPEGATLGAGFVMAPSRTFEATELFEGKVHLDLLAGRESVRGKTGGNEALSLEEGGARILVPAGSLDEDTAISLSPTTLSDFVVSSPSLEALSEIIVDLSGETLGMAAELSVEIASAPSGSLLLAKVERMGGMPRLVVVGLAEWSGGRVVSKAYPGLPGVKEGARYVFYSSVAPVGFVSGVTSTSEGPAKAVVQTAGLPFVALSDVGGRYVAAALAGTATVSASVPGTSLVGSASGNVTEGETATVNVALAGAVTTASVSPPNGATAVALDAQVEITTSAPINGTTVTTENLVLYKGAVKVPVRFILSGSGKSLSVVPEARLEPLTTYTLSVSGLGDIYGGLVYVAEVSFTTRDDKEPEYDTSKLTFSMPDASGTVSVTAPSGTVPPGTNVLIVNAGNGVVLSLTAGNDGSVSGEIPASISDRILVTLTDPAGNVTSFERSQFVAPDGRTAVGPGGGVVEGPGGMELRIPEGAVGQGVVFKIESFGEDLFPAEERPPIQEGNFGAGLKIESAEKPTFLKEVDLVFPKPSDAPEGAFYHVYRRLEGPNGEVVFETLDHAFLEGEGENAKVITSSYPFSGYTNSFGSFSYGGFLAPVPVSYNILMWSYNQPLPGQSTSGVITGTVLRTTYVAGSDVPQYVGIPNVLVTQTDGVGNPLLDDNANVAITQSDGTFTLWDERFSGGTVEIAAVLNDEIQTARAYETVIDETRYPGLAYYEKVATANITFPAEAPAPPPPQIEIRLMRLEEGRRKAVDGLVVAGTPLIIGFKSNYEVRGASIKGEDLAVQVDPLKGVDPLGMDFILNGEYIPPTPGSYTVAATALPPFGSPVTASITFRVIAPGGSNKEVLQGEPPAVITHLTVPKNNAQGVPVSIFPQVVFTEPVKNLPGNVSLVEASDGTPVGFTLSGVSPQDEALEDIQSAEAEVTSLTLQPLTGLKFGTEYRLSLSDAIIDLDTENDLPAPKNLVPFETEFKTFGPETLGGTEERFGSSGMIVLGDRAYLVENYFSGGTLRVYDITDPVSPQEIESARNYVNGRPVDIGGEEGMVVIGTSSTNRSLPSNLYVFDVTSDSASPWIGAVSVASSAVEGYLQKVVVQNGRAYTLTGRRGVQVVDLGKAIQNFTEAGAPYSSGYWDMIRGLGTAGQGFGHDAVFQTIPLRNDSGQDWNLNDIAVGVLQGQIHAAVTGEAPLILVNTETGFAGPAAIIQTQEGASLAFGSAIALAQREGRDIALVGGTGTVPGVDGQVPVLAVVDLSDLQNPFTLSIIDLDIDGWPADILLSEDLAIVSGSTKAALINLTDLNAPKAAGVIQGVGGTLGLTKANVLLSTAMSVFGGETELGGLRTAALGSIAIIRQITPIIVALDNEGKTVEPIEVKYQLIAPPENLAQGEIQLFRENQMIATYPVQNLTDGTFDMTIPAGVMLQTPPENVDICIRRPNGTLTPPFKTSIRNPDPTTPTGAGTGVPVASAVFESVSPGHATRGAPNVRVTITGSNLGSLHSVHVRDVSGEWSTVEATSRKATQLELVLPSSLLSQEGFIQLSPVQEEALSLAFLVSTPGLPIFGGGAGIKVDSASPDELGVGGEKLHVTGEGFVSGMSLVLGRQGSSGFVLPTTFISDTDLEADLPLRYVGRAEDLAAAVLAADGRSLSTPLPLQSTVSDIVDPATQFDEGEIGVTSISGDLLWNRGEQELEIEGVGLAPGMEVVFTAHRGAEARTYSAPLRAGSLKVTVPTQLTSYPSFSVQFQGTAPGQPSFLSAPSFFVPQEPFQVPFGGQAKFVVKKDTLADRLYFLSAQPLGVGLARPTARNVVLPRLTFEPPIAFTVTENPLDTRGTPTVQVERERFDPDPDAFYLRGLHLTADPDTGLDYGPVTIQASKGHLSVTMKVKVVEQALGKKNNKHDSDIVKVANRYGIPPHFLKSQVQHESAFREKSFRYEPWTVDLRHLTGDGTIRDKSANQTVYGDALHDSSKRWIEQYPFDKYAIGGTANAAPASTSPLTFSIRACQPPTVTPPCASASDLEFEFAPTVAYSRERTPVESQGRSSRVRASIAGSPRALNAEPLPVGTRWSRARGSYSFVGPPSPSDWSVDYRAGRVRLYWPLAPGETLTVTYELVSRVPVAVGAFGSSAPATFDLTKVKETVKLDYSPGESVAAWFTNNLLRQIARGKKPGNFFGTDSEKHTEFDDATKDPIDTRLHAATAQYYAASSYGPLQLTLLPWLQGTKKTAFDQVLKVEDVPLYRLASDWDQAWDKGLSLGALYHQTQLVQLGLSCTSCDTVAWERMWSQVFEQYNAGGPKYIVGRDLKSEIIREAKKYGPF